MPTIKVKKEMNEKELIKHLVNQESTTVYFSGISYDGAWSIIEPEIESKVQFEFKDSSTRGKTFTVEVEEEITEDTVIPNLVEVYHSGCKQIGVDAASFKNTSISEIFDGRPSKAFYIINDDLTMTLIWKNGKLVE